MPKPRRAAERGMTRGGRNKDRDTPERRCIATGETRPTHAMVRFVIGPDDAVVPDILGRLPGRGIWVSAERAALDRAARKGLFKRAARRPVTVPDDLVATVESLIARRVIELLSLARKGGRAVAGFEKVRGWLDNGTARVLIQASDGSARGKTKLRAPEVAAEGLGTYVGCLDASEIGLAFGREHVIHAALAAGGLTTRVVEEAARLAALRGQFGGASAGKDLKDA